MRRFTICDAPQRSDEWRRARLGRATGSRAADILAVIKSGEAAARRDYKTELVCERLTGQPAEEGFITADMARGIELEPEAFALYEAVTGQLVERSGFLSHTELMAGCSLDGHILDFTGLIEIKAPRSANHLAIMRSGGVPSKYHPQILHNMFITGAQWCDFVSFDPRFPPEMRLYVHRVNRDDRDVVGYEKKLVAFLEEVDAEERSLRGWSALEEVS